MSNVQNIKLNRVFTHQVIFFPDTHTYRVPGITQEIFSVTHIINPNGVFSSPRIKAAAELGQEIHQEFNNYILGAESSYGKVFEQLLDKIALSREALAPGTKLDVSTDRRFVAEFILSDGNKFYVGGTCDAIMTHENGTEIIELKTTTRESNDHLIQLAAYTKFAEMCGGGNHWGTLAYLSLKDSGQKVKHISLSTLDVFWEQFLAKIACFITTNTKVPEVFTYIDGGDYKELTAEEVRELIIEYSALAREVASLTSKQKKIREQLDVISEKNNLISFEIDGAKYAKISGVKKCIDAELIEEQYPQLVKYEPFTRVAISCR